MFKKTSIKICDLVKRFTLFFSFVLSIILFINPVFANDLDALRVSEYTKNKIKNDLINDNLEMGSPIFLRSFKKESRLELWIKEKNKPTYKLFRKYYICKYSGDFGPKQHEGDKIAPEGFYQLTQNSLNPHSNFHLSVNLGYPNKYDSYYNRTGSMLMIHGNCVSIGCYALGDSQIEEVYYLMENAFKSGQQSIPVHLFPFQLTKYNLSQFRKNRWYNFWLELQAGYQYVESFKMPPNITVESGKYIINN